VGTRDMVGSRHRVNNPKRRNIANAFKAKSFWRERGS
jgi:hypothetical protein